MTQQTYETGLRLMESCTPASLKAMTWRGKNWQAFIQARQFEPEEPRFVHYYVGMRARNEEAAKDGLWLILQAQEVLTHTLSTFIGTDLFIDCLPAESPSALRRLSFHSLSPEIGLSGFPVACALAGKASNRRQRKYALAKYWWSRKTVSIDEWDLDPRTGISFPLPKRPVYQVQLAYALIMAYSVIEELGLQINASADNPSLINGQWNAVVLSELSERLKSSGIDVDSKISWVSRGPRRTTERSRPFLDDSTLRWSDGFHIRDVEVSVMDAIRVASWLRSKVSSHRLWSSQKTQHIKALSPYDVLNVQLLARRLILESFGFWRHQAET